jgi:hypothetical protein
MGIVSAVKATARTIAELSLMRLNRRLRETPQIAGGRKRSRQNLDRDATWNLSRQNKHGAKDKAALIQTVRREIDPTTKPPV